MSDNELSNNWGSFFETLDLRDYLGIAQRRALAMLLPAVAVIIIVAVIAERLPNVYRCQTVVLVDPQKVPDSYVPSTITGTISDRLSTIQEQVTSPTRLKHLIDSMGLYPDLRAQMGLQQVIHLMQSSISVELVDAGGRSLTGFRIAFKGRNPVETAQVTNQIAAMFTEENLKAREQATYGTSDFLQDELQKTSKQLQDKEEELRAIRLRYIQDLPESQQFHVQALEGLRMQMRDAQERISRAQQQIVYLRSLSATTSPSVDLDIEARGSGSSSATQDLENKLAALKTRYGPSHPDVRKLQAKLDQLRASDAEKHHPESSTPVISAASPHQIHNPVVDAQLEQLDQEVKQQTEVLSRLQKEADFHTSKIEQVPIFEEKIAGVTRDYESLKHRYNQLVEKKLSADTASALETRQKGERFEILDPAQVPERPYGPNRLLIVGAGVVVGLLLGVATGVTLEVLNGAVLNERVVEQIISKRSIARIPELLSPKLRLRRRLQACSAVLGTCVISVGLGYTISHFVTRLF